MANNESDFETKHNIETAHSQYLKNRESLIDAARESARTFDKAVLTFGAAVFGASIAFVKDVAPNPIPNTLPWLGISWGLFSIGLLSILLSFLFSHRACHYQIELEYGARNPWSTLTTVCNYLCIGLLFLGLLCWSIFAYNNLAQGENQLAKDHPIIEKHGYSPADSPHPISEGYAPPSGPKPSPAQIPIPQPQTPSPAPTAPNTPKK